MKKDQSLSTEETEESFELKKQELRAKKLKDADAKVTALLNELAKDDFLLDADMIVTMFGCKTKLVIRDMKKLR